MQITLIQVEIEQALKNYINEQVNLKDGMEIFIELAATRGTEGFKATIDIVPAKEPVKVRKIAPEKVEPVRDIPTTVGTARTGHAVVREEPVEDSVDEVVETEEEVVETPSVTSDKKSLFAGFGGKE